MQTAVGSGLLRKQYAVPKGLVCFRVQDTAERLFEIFKHNRKASKIVCYNSCHYFFLIFIFFIFIEKFKKAFV